MVEPAENGTRDDLRSGGVSVRGGRQRNALREPLMRPGAVEVDDILIEHRAKMLFTENDDMSSSNGEYQ
jgi:hypothetical protein